MTDNSSNGYEHKMADDDGIAFEIIPGVDVWVPGGRKMTVADRRTAAIEIARKTNPWCPMHLRIQLHEALK